MSHSIEIAKKRILLVSPLPPPYGGAATWTSALLRYGLLTKDYRFRIVNTAYTTERLTHQGADINTGEIKRLIWILLRLIKQLFVYKPDLIHLNCCLSTEGIFRDLIIGAAVKLFGKKLAVHYRGHIPDFYRRCKRRISFSAMIQLSRIADINISVNEKSRAFIGKNLKIRNVSKSIFLPNFIDDHRIVNTDVIKHRKVGNCTPKCFYAGSLSVAKGFPEFIEVAKRKNNLQFVAAGSIHADCEHLVKNLPSNVDILGDISPDRIFELLKETDIFLLLSHSEGFPNAVVEAMATGLPVVGTNTGAIPDMIDNGKGGYICDIGNSDQVVTAIGRLENPDLRYNCGTYNVEKVLASYAYSIVIKQICKVYDYVIAGINQVELFTEKRSIE